MTINHLSRANANTVDVTPVAAITAPSIAVEGAITVLYTRDAPAGVLASPFAFNSVIEVEKTTPADVIAVADAVSIDIPTQKQAGAGGGSGICVKASSATDTHVKVLLNG